MLQIRFPTTSSRSPIIAQARDGGSGLATRAVGARYFIDTRFVEFRRAANNSDWADPAHATKTVGRPVRLVAPVAPTPGCFARRRCGLLAEQSADTQNPTVAHRIKFRAGALGLFGRSRRRLVDPLLWCSGLPAIPNVALVGGDETKPVGDQLNGLAVGVAVLCEMREEGVDLLPGFRCRCEIGACVFRARSTSA